jgi:rod shape-determining protein MreC
MTRERLQFLIPLALILIALVGFVLDRAGLLQPVDGLLQRLTAPIQEGVSGVSTQLSEVAQTARDLRELRQRNEELEAQNAALLLENVRLREIETEAALLRDLLNFTQPNPSYQVKGARVVGRKIAQDPSNLQKYITIDVGGASGIERNMPVITDRGLVGRISDVGETWSRVLLIIDPQSTVNALTQSTRASGSIQGQADGSLIMRSIPQGDTVSVGDTVFTSGLGGNFPRQLLIGQIIEADRKDYELYQSAIVQPTVDFDHLEAVLIITDFEPIEETDPAEDEEQ